MAAYFGDGEKSENLCDNLLIVLTRMYKLLYIAGGAARRQVLKLAPHSSLTLRVGVEDL